MFSIVENKLQHLQILGKYFTMNEWMKEWMFNDTPVQKINRLLCVRQS